MRGPFTFAKGHAHVEWAVLAGENRWLFRPLSRGPGFIRGPAAEVANGVHLSLNSLFDWPPIPYRLKGNCPDFRARKMQL